MNRGIEFEVRDGEVVCRLTPQEATDKGVELRLAASDAYSATLPPGVR
jgi:hypothetical protein